jgi:hypothetical protein
MKEETINQQDIILKSIKNSLKNIQKDIKIQIEQFYKSPDYKSYSGVRNDKGYKKWKDEVLKRFNNTCSVCLSNDNLILRTRS